MGLKTWIVGGGGLIVALAAALTIPAFFASPPPPADAKIDRIVVDKSRHEMTLIQGEIVIRTYKVALGSGGIERKTREGDRRTPEGLYVVDRHNQASGFHRSLHISYPSPADSAAAQARGEKPGGDVMIHGLRNGFGWIGRWHRAVDWTAGCVAVTNDEIDEIAAAVTDGTPIEFRR
jgi:murein L,D-transpeptidase YafK